MAMTREVRGVGDKWKREELRREIHTYIMALKLDGKLFHKCAPQ